MLHVISNLATVMLTRCNSSIQYLQSLNVLPKVHFMGILLSVFFAPVACGHRLQW
ncbi:hypothetical protein PtA15_13A390 [Puccinia triticina]|uniref:Uncharacterized protein n=1 Tax=Puccinia triticina TaxID=208348 RepID=A0ABY7D275_9BASI|nr:uncharacterized protein PtA15_13A390 [Puccinia triticina]WAQ90990.1 hypothetical protein PtA15_13A390 [Puccinia triticina]WAR61178.1 hypothetical protein PtB15_13B430 [Puccinia triticina]